MICPQCRAETQEGEPRCEKCGAALAYSSEPTPQPDASTEVLWRGIDPAKFSALQAALHNEDIPFWEISAYDPNSGFLSSRPFYLEAIPGYEIRVRGQDRERAKAALEWVESREAELVTSDDPRALLPGGGEDERIVPLDWDRRAATSEAWAGDDPEMAKYITDALAENGIPSVTPIEPGNRPRICVRQEDLSRAREIVREVVEGAPPA